MTKPLDKKDETVDIGTEKPKEKTKQKESKKYTQSDVDAMVAEALAKKTHEQKVERETEAVASYKAGTLLTKVDFIMRLKNMNVPKRYLVLFRDEDSVMSDEDIWKTIRFSNIDSDGEQ